MWFIEWIQELVYAFGGFLYWIRRETQDWWWPFNLVSPYFLYASVKVMTVGDALSDVNDFLDDVWSKVQQIFDIEWIYNYLEPWLDYASTAWRWVKDAFSNVWNIVDSWWTSAKYIVLAWIDEATQGFAALLVLWDEFWKITWPQWISKLEVLWSDVNHFFTNTLPNLLNYLKLEHWWGSKLFAVDGLIGSKLAEWFPFYDDVAEFFSDPGEFLLSRLTDWFLGPEE